MLLAAGLLFAGILPGAVRAQEATERYWQPLVEQDSVAFSYLFYGQADSRNNGVVVRLVNRNPFAVDYAFKIIFRADGAEHIEQVYGSLAPGQMKTGELDGLFWIPFPDGRSIGEIGLRGYRIVRKAGEEAGAEAANVPA